MTRPAVFLDRDGTMVHDVGYLNRLEDIRWYPWTIDAIRLLNRAGFLVCVTTNQSGIAMEWLTEEILGSLHAEMTRALEAEGARIDAWFHCPHHVGARVASLKLDCDCRKPRPGMIRQAQMRFAIDLSRSFVIGDKLADVGLATSVGAQGILVQTGYGEAVLREHRGAVPGAAHVAADLMAATAWLLDRTGPGGVTRDVQERS